MCDECIVRCQFKYKCGSMVYCGRNPPPVKFKDYIKHQGISQRNSAERCIYCEYATNGLESGRCAYCLSTPNLEKFSPAIDMRHDYKWLKWREREEKAHDKQ